MDKKVVVLLSILLFCKNLLGSQLGVFTLANKQECNEQSQEVCGRVVDDFYLDMICLITNYCTIKDICNLRQVCKKLSDYDIFSLVCRMHNTKEHICFSTGVSELAKDENYAQGTRGILYYANQQDDANKQKNEKIFTFLYAFHQVRRDCELKKLYEMPENITNEDRIAAYRGTYVNNSLIEKAVQKAKENEIVRQKKHLSDKISFIRNIDLRDALLINTEIEFSFDLFHLLTRSNKDKSLKMVLLRKKFKESIKKYSVDAFENVDFCSNFEEYKEQFDCLISIGVDMHTCYGSGHKFLFPYLCSNDKCFDLLEYLVKKGIDINFKYHTQMPLSYAIKAKKNFKFLLERGAKIGELSQENLDAYFDQACEVKNTAAVRYLINKGAKVNGCSFRYQNNSCLHWACLSGSVEIAQILIDNGADLIVENDNGRNPIEYMEGKDVFKELFDSLPFFNRYYRLISIARRLGYFVLIFSSFVLVCFGREVLVNNLVNKAFGGA